MTTEIQKIPVILQEVQDKREEEIREELLEEKIINYAKKKYGILTIGEIAKKYGVLEKKVSLIIKQNNIKKRKNQNKIIRTDFTPEEKDLIKRSYSSLTTREIAKLLNCTIKKVSEAYRELGIIKKRVIEDDFKDIEKLNLSEEQIELIREKYQNMTQLELAKEFGFTKNQIVRIVKKYGMKKEYGLQRRKKRTLFDWNGFPG